MDGSLRLTEQGRRLGLVDEARWAACSEKRDAIGRDSVAGLLRSNRVTLFFNEVTTTAAAPSLMPDALPAVTEPSFLNAARILASVSIVVPALTCSSVSKVTSPFLLALTTGTIWLLNRPSAIAAAARRFAHAGVDQITDALDATALADARLLVGATP